MESGALRKRRASCQAWDKFEDIYFEGSVPIPGY